ncbi:RecF/RecN/SMC N terminal domain-containing protein [Phycomyces blakesleeanus]
MDEIDAALDFRNVSIVANYIAERTKNAQFVIISLRNNMFELADRLVGIYKTQDCTKSIAINPAMVMLDLPQPEELSEKSNENPIEKSTEQSTEQSAEMSTEKFTEKSSSSERS